MRAAGETSVGQHSGSQFFWWGRWGGGVVLKLLNSHACKNVLGSSVDELTDEHIHL